MKKSFKKFFAGLATLAMVTGPMVTAYAADEVVVGGNFELSGDAAEYGTPMTEGAKLAVEEWNAKGGVNGMTIKYVDRDNQTNKTESAAAVTDLISQGAVGIVGPATTGNANAAFPILNDAGVVNVLPAATGDGLTLDDKGDVMKAIFRVCYENSFMSKAAAQYAKDELGVKKVAVVTNPGEEYSLGLSDAFIDHAEKIGLEIVTIENFQNGDRDFMTIVTNLSGKEFDAIYMPAYYPEGGPFIRQIREAGIEAPIFGADGFANEGLVEAAGAEFATDVYYAQDFDIESDDPAVVAFKEAYQAAYNKAADVFAAQAYDSMNLIIQAIEAADSTDPEAIIAAVAATKQFEGVTGTFDIDEFHNPVKPASVVKLVNGKKDSTIEVKIED